MAYKTRVNKKTNRTEYKVRYYFVEEGRKRDSETGWFESLAKAEKEAKRLKETKEKADREKVTQKRNKHFVTALEEYIADLRKIYKDNPTNTNKQNIYDTNAIRNKHMPLDIQNIRICDVTAMTFKLWIKSINDKPTIGGNYVRSCLSALSKFNVWLSQSGFYIEDEMEGEVEATIRAFKVKNRKVNNREVRGERNLISVVDMERIAEYYANKGLDNFKNFYLYTMFYVLFYSGVRVEELVALQWKFIDLRSGERVIRIENAISQQEKTAIALERTKRGEYRTKNVSSVRIIPIFDFYYDLLVDYKESYKYEFGLSDEELEEAFVFPRLVYRKPFAYANAVWLRERLREVIEALDMKKTDLQMFRHSCAMFLILLPPDGLGYTEEQVKDYFGHVDTAMLRNVYAKLNTLQKSERMRSMFGDIYRPSDNTDRTELEKLKYRMIERIRGDNEAEKKEARKDRIFKQIDRVEKSGKDIYYYKKADEKIIKEYKKKKKPRIKFMEG